MQKRSRSGRPTGRRRAAASRTGPSRRCRVCGRRRPLTAFDRAGRYRRRVCRPCRGRQRRTYYQANRELSRAAVVRRIEAGKALVGAVLAESACADCGLADPVCLEFHHLRDKALTVSQLIFSRRRSLVALAAEMDKCLLLCGVCHRRRTLIERRTASAAVDGMGATALRRKAARDFVREQLSGASCRVCGLSDVDVMDFHHIGPKHRKVSRLVSGAWSPQVIAAELAHCVVLCVNCHRREEAFKRGDWRLGLHRDPPLSTDNPDEEEIPE